MQRLAAAVTAQRRLVVATIVDARTQAAFDRECDIVVLAPRGWRRALRRVVPDLLLLGAPSADAPAWHSELPGVVAWAQQRCVPTVYWSTMAGGGHGRDLEVARLVDHVFTIDLASIPRYVLALGHRRVHVLPHAADPALTRSEQGEVADDVEVLTADVFDRGASQTAVDPRVFDLVARGTSVISGFSPSIRTLFGDLIVASDSAEVVERARHAISADREATRRRRAEGVRHVRAQHTYAARLRRMAATVAGTDPAASEDPVAAQGRPGPTTRAGASIAALVAAEPGGAAWSVPYEHYPPSLRRQDPDRRFVTRPGDDGIEIEWSFAHPAPRWRWFSEPISVAAFANGVVFVRMDATGPADRVGFNLAWRDAAGVRFGLRPYQLNRLVRAPIPPQARELELSLRLHRSGTALVRSISLGDADPDPGLVLDGWAKRVLIVTNVYPSYESLYQNGFVHSRVQGYRARGVDADVFVMTPGERHREFHGVDVLSGDADTLRELLASGRYEQVLVHFLRREMWQELRPVLDRIAVTIWVHGFEIQAWWRRAFLHAGTDEQAQAVAASDARMALWREVGEVGDLVRLVFVSHAFRAEVAEDQQQHGFGLDDRVIEIIPNPIDTDLFSYRPKSVAQRTRILMIRPFASLVYAQDLAVAAIGILAREPWFAELEFRIVGDGPLFDEVTAPLRAYPNVILERRFLSHREIAERHQEYGVFLVPTRADSQGVSRDEAMSSGLVPVTNDIATIREFLSEAEGYLAPEGDATGLADAIRDLYLHPERFAAKSRAAAERIRRTVASDVVIPAEMALFDRAPAR